MKVIMPVALFPATSTLIGVLECARCGQSFALWESAQYAYNLLAPVGVGTSELGYHETWSQQSRLLYKHAWAVTADGKLSISCGS